MENTKGLPLEQPLLTRDSRPGMPPVVAQEAGVSERPISSQMEEGAGTLPPEGSDMTAASEQPQTLTLARPLLQDLSLYANPHLEHAASENDAGTSLEELAHLVRLSKHQERKRDNTRTRLQRSLISTALAARFTRCADLASRNLADCFRGDDKKTFAGLYHAVFDVRSSCDELRRYALLEPEMDPPQSPSAAVTESLDPSATSTSVSTAAGASPVANFLTEISASARETFLGFLTQIRTNPDYLATRICTLTGPELAMLTSFHQRLEPIESVLPHHGRTPSRALGTSASKPSAQERNSIERLLSFHRHDPLSALIHTCFANSAGPDSAEDKRRTSVWASACAKLISEQRPGAESLLTSVLNAWASMRDWPGRSNMERYIMKILEDGAFLLDRAEDQHGTRFNLSDWTNDDQQAAEEFYKRATDELFDIVDDEDGLGIPEGLLELANEILVKLDSKYVESMRRWFVYKWIFSVWLLGVVIHPESYGMMTEYHITEYGRQKILKAVATKAQELVVDMLWKVKSSTPAPTPPEVKSHVDSILSRFRSRSRRAKTRLLPARSITSLRETTEVHPFLVISPADLATLVNALFPERRPQSGHSSFRSGAPSISGLSAVSQAASAADRANFDTASVISISADSVDSDVTASTAGYLEEQRTGSSMRYSPPVLEPSAQKRALGNYEDDGYKLRLALHDMAQTLGQDVVLGSCHPCAERWAVLFISSDGDNLSTQMTYDPDDDVEEEENSSTSDTDEDEAEDDRPELDKDYHQLRDSILKFVEEYEVPRSANEEGARGPTFSNRATGLKKYRSRNKVITAERTGSRNPYRQKSAAQNSSAIEESPVTAPEKAASRPDEDGEQSEPSSVLIAMLKAASAQARAQSDFVAAHQYWKTLQQLNALSSASLRRNGFATLLDIFSRGPRESIRRSASAIEEYDAWLVWLKQSQERAEGQIDSAMRRLRALRDKMWYVTDVRYSAPYEASRNIAVALKTMGMPRRWDKFKKLRNQVGRGPAANYMFRTESQIMEMIAAPEEQGGPNKLSDDQADKTWRWLQQYDVLNFCQGEERIHMFCLELMTCIDRLVGETLNDTPVLWSSELYYRDRRALERSRGLRDRDSQSWDDASSVISDPHRAYAASGRTGSIPRDLRTISAHNTSQQSIDSGRFSFSRASTALSDIVDTQDYFGALSPVHTIDASSTFWSPFQTGLLSGLSGSARPQTPTTSLSSLSGGYGHSQYSHPSHTNLSPQSKHNTSRPGTSASSSETVFQQRLSDEKSRFLANLRKTLTGLLLSDLGNLVFAQGSETDSWFGTLGQQCIDRLEAKERRRQMAALKERKKTARSSTTKGSLKQRVLEKKKSFGDLRGAGSGAEPADTMASSNSPTGEAPSPGTGSHGNDSSATSDTISARPQHAPSRRGTLPEFPFVKAYQRLLRLFCVHPNPYVKLNSLIELEHLILASLASSPKKAKLIHSSNTLFDAAASEASNDKSGRSANQTRPKPLEETIDNIRERRSHAALIQSPLTPFSPTTSFGRIPAVNTDARSMKSTARDSNTDAVVQVLHSLFRDGAVRPKALFRDLQFVAAFVAPAVLDASKAFWNAALAALLLKQEVCTTMLEVADDVVAYHTTYKGKTAPPFAGTSTDSHAKPTRSGGSEATDVSSAYTGSESADISHATPSDPAAVTSAPSGSLTRQALQHHLQATTSNDGSAGVRTSSSKSPPSPLAPPSPPPVQVAYKLADAARMYTITAKEGDPAAQRELGFFYMTYPELVDRITLPLSKPREVFRQAVMGKYGPGSGSSSAGGASSAGMRGYGASIAGGSSSRGAMGAAGLGLTIGGVGSSAAPGSAFALLGAGSVTGPSGTAASDTMGAGDVRSDPALMCVAFHWMKEAAGKGGDELARTFLEQNENAGLD